MRTVVTQKYAGTKNRLSKMATARKTQKSEHSAKQLITRLSEEFGLPLDVPWNFIPEQLVLYSKKK